MMDPMTRDDMHFDLYHIKQRYDELIEDYNNMEEKLSEGHQKEIATLEDDNQVLRIELEEAKGTIANAEDNAYDAEDLAIQVEDLTHANEDLQDKVDNLEEEAVDLTEELADAIDQLDTIRAESDS